MGSSVDNSTKIQTEITNDFLQQLENVCVATCTSEASGNTIIVAGKTGDISISATCSSDASCTMTNQATSVAQNTTSTMAKQESTAVTDFFGGFSWQDMNNGISVTNSMINHITQISTQTCNANSSSTTNNNFIYVQEGGETGNLSIAATGNANASCVMSNMSKIEAYNEVQSNTDQSSKTVGQFSMYGVAAMAVVLVIGIVVVLVVAVGSLGFIFKGKGKKGEKEGGDDLTAMATSIMSGKGGMGGAGLDLGGSSGAAGIAKSLGISPSQAQMLAMAL